MAYVVIVDRETEWGPYPSFRQALAQQEKLAERLREKGWRERSVSCFRSAVTLERDGETIEIGVTHEQIASERS